MMGPSRYEIRVRGRVGEKVAARFEGFDMEVEPVETVLRGPVQDQSALHGILGQIESLGLELVEVRRVEGSPPER
jgi:lactate dehydrogenase-like 2-hydroxyacid dehydrogenase